MSEKLQKVLARVGLGSRRYMEEVIAAGRVSVNGQVAQVGERIEPGDELRIDGRKVQFQIEDEIRRRVLIYYKPEGEICSRNDPENRPTVFEQLPQITGDRWVMVGRLDINSTGLLLFTNDGELANRLMHPSSEIEREYAVRVMGEVTPQLKNNMLQGVVLDDGPAKFESFSEIGGDGINRWYQVVVKEGRNREVRRIFESQGLKVSRLLRTRYGSVILPRELRTGRWIELDKQDIDNLTKSVELKPRQGTGLFGMAKRRTERMQDKPMAARRGGYLRQQRRDSDENQPQQSNGYQDNRGERRTGRTEGGFHGNGFNRSERRNDGFNNNRNDRNSENFGNRERRNDNFGNRERRNDSVPSRAFSGNNKGFKKF
ncbi:MULTISPECIES: 23S rRNA pseudouridine(2605) synthase RluB [unclassified Acinetobacter]|uniref:23S rRNA pseudouridine(2605) synthase RluB n=1 Tax=unclassified Acinetobacter TaxID=196816 RepID=UPI0015D3C193|nr:23S rRNA pseudouridine(2605) synthase RluB [Acinetobacter sp. YH12138]